MSDYVHPCFDYQFDYILRQARDSGKAWPRAATVTSLYLNVDNPAFQGGSIRGFAESWKTTYGKLQGKEWAHVTEEVWKLCTNNRRHFGKHATRYLDLAGMEYDDSISSRNRSAMQAQDTYRPSLRELVGINPRSIRINPRPIIRPYCEYWGVLIQSQINQDQWQTVLTNLQPSTFNQTPPSKPPSTSEKGREGGFEELDDGFVPPTRDEVDAFAAGHVPPLPKPKVQVWWNEQLDSDWRDADGKRIKYWRKSLVVRCGRLPVVPDPSAQSGTTANPVRRVVPDASRRQSDCDAEAVGSLLDDILKRKPAPAEP